MTVEGAVSWSVAPREKRRELRIPASSVLGGYSHEVTTPYEFFPN